MLTNYNWGKKVGYKIVNNLHLYNTYMMNLILYEIIIHRIF